MLPPLRDDLIVSATNFNENSSQDFHFLDFLGMFFVCLGLFVEVLGPVSQKFGRSQLSR